MARLLFVALLLGGAGSAFAQSASGDSAQALQAMPGARIENPASRVGGRFWFESSSRPFSPDFFEAADLQRRVPMDRVRSFLVTAVEPPAGEGERGLLYRVRLETGRDAYIAIADFESHLYVDLPDLSETRLKTDLYTSPQAYFFSIKSIFSEEPGELWERVRLLGPSRIIQPAPGAPSRSGTGQKPGQPSPGGR
ncbi:MAG TPA: hypothetical protein VFP70_10960 [Burkholderiales bacterium]|nr:hypothetical protein [Burkholderiales bacterium]